jgi:hypothetical protein
MKYSFEIKGHIQGGEGPDISVRVVVVMQKKY